MKRILVLALTTLALLPLTSLSSRAAEPFTVINAQKLKTMIDDRENTTRIFDSRSKGEYEQKHITGAVSLPLGEMTANLALLGTPDESRRVFYCSGST